MTKPPKKSASQASVEDNMTRTLDVMNTINLKATMLLEKAEKIADQLSVADLDPREDRQQDEDQQQGEDHSSATDIAEQGVQPPEVDPSPVSPRARARTERDEMVDEITLLVFQNVMGRIQPLLDALEKVRDSRQPQPPMTEEEHMSQMLADMRQRIERRRGFLTR